MERIAEMKSTSNDCATMAVARRALIDAERALYEAKERVLRGISRRQTVRRVSRTRKDVNEREPGGGDHCRRTVGRRDLPSSR